eukprot:COSAG02_NODE_15169_length_1197_cov_1.806011_1_plen_44_part_10
MLFIDRDLFDEYTANFDCDDLGTQTQSALEVTSGASAVDTWTRA